eukprot:TRINITY_DN926_c0_g1_i7.p1 TRINITY_DN926_c0_g1~~TRINITY_DN926_c0_g1_i7.p1  ORF type:complete len:986 (-),score=279.90 TRINITY_DN926_c0_g1_i7:184-3141(-)
MDIMKFRPADSPPETTVNAEKGKIHAGRWSREEHELFIKGVEKFGKEWKRVATMIPTRSVVQIRTHAQKYFQKLAKTNAAAQKRLSKRRVAPPPRRAKRARPDEPMDFEDLSVTAHKMPKRTMTRQMAAVIGPIIKSPNQVHNLPTPHPVEAALMLVDQKVSESLKAGNTTPRTKQAAEWLSMLTDDKVDELITETKDKTATFGPRASRRTSRVANLSLTKALAMSSRKKDDLESFPVSTHRKNRLRDSNGNAIYDPSIGHQQHQHDFTTSASGSTISGIPNGPPDVLLSHSGVTSTPASSSTLSYPNPPQPQVQASFIGGGPQLQPKTLPTPRPQTTIVPTTTSHAPLIYSTGGAMNYAQPGKRNIISGGLDHPNLTNPHPGSGLNQQRFQTQAGQSTSTPQQKQQHQQQQQEQQHQQTKNDYENSLSNSISSTTLSMNRGNMHNGEQNEDLTDLQIPMANKLVQQLAALSMINENRSEQHQHEEQKQFDNNNSNNNNSNKTIFSSNTPKNIDNHMFMDKDDLYITNMKRPGQNEGITQTDSNGPNSIDNNTTRRQNNDRIENNFDNNSNSMMINEMSVKSSSSVISKVSSHFPRKRTSSAKSPKRVPRPPSMPVPPELLKQKIKPTKRPKSASTSPNKSNHNNGNNDNDNFNEDLQLAMDVSIVRAELSAAQNSLTTIRESLKQTNKESEPRPLENSDSKSWQKYSEFMESKCNLQTSLIQQQSQMLLLLRKRLASVLPQNEDAGKDLNVVAKQSHKDTLNFCSKIKSPLSSTDNFNSHQSHTSHSIPTHTPKSMHLEQLKEQSQQSQQASELSLAKQQQQQQQQQQESLDIPSKSTIINYPTSQINTISNVCSMNTINNGNVSITVQVHHTDSSSSLSSPSEVYPHDDSSQNSSSNNNNNNIMNNRKSIAKKASDLVSQRLSNDPVYISPDRPFSKRVISPQHNNGNRTFSPSKWPLAPSNIPRPPENPPEDILPPCGPPPF